MTEKECFIIMPITTPTEFISAYKDDCEHFLHVMQCLFKPAIEKAGFKPILPVTQGSEIIHGDIISRIESSDLVLCDMSILNPNVFFELGIRTALNKPVCLIKDTIVEKVPFDTGIINYHVYLPDLSSWIVKDEIAKLSRHINESFTRSDNCNSLWKYFSLKSIATPSKKLEGNAGKIDYLTMQVEAIRRQLGETSDRKSSESSTDLNAYRTKEILNNLKTSEESLHEYKWIPNFWIDLRRLLSKHKITASDINVKVQSNPDGRLMLIIPREKIEIFTAETLKELRMLSESYGVELQTW